MHRKLWVITTILLSGLLGPMGVAEDTPIGPQPGDVYKEFAFHTVGDRPWRVTNPQAKELGAKKYLPNPIWEVEVKELEGAIRAEVMLDRWGGHLDTTNPRIRFNEQEWLPLDPPIMHDKKPLPENYYFQDNPVIPVPLNYLRNGKNIVEGTCNHKKPEGWGQWGMYSLVLRVYYNPTVKPHTIGRIVSPQSGTVLGEHPEIVLQADQNEVDRVDVFAWYEGYDENGNGRFRDWHGGWFKPYRDEPTEWQGHVGTLRGPPFRLVWNTRWVPDQVAGQIRLLARIRDKSGVWSVTGQVTDLSLQRCDETVTLYCVNDFPAEFGVRAGQRRSCTIKLPQDYNPESVLDVSLHYRTWHGWDKHHAPYKLNDHEHLHEGKNHHYHYHIHAIPREVLRPGDNRFEIYSATEHHMLEILWPGPALVIRTKR